LKDTTKEKQQAEIRMDANTKSKENEKESPGDTRIPTERVEVPKENQLTAVLAKWPEILEEVRKQKKSTHAFLLEGKPKGLKGESLLLVFKEGYSFHRDKFNQPENRTVVEEVLTKFLGRRITLESLMESECAHIDDSPGVVISDNNGDQKEDACVSKAVELFGAQLVHVRKDK